MSQRLQLPSGDRLVSAIGTRGVFMASPLSLFSSTLLPSSRWFDAVFPKILPWVKVSLFGFAFYDVVSRFYIATLRRSIDREWVESRFYRTAFAKTILLVIGSRRSWYYQVLRNAIVTPNWFV